MLTKSNGLSTDEFRASLEIKHLLKIQTESDLLDSAYYICQTLDEQGAILQKIEQLDINLTELGLCPDERSYWVNTLLLLLKIDDRIDLPLRLNLPDQLDQVVRR